MPLLVTAHQLQPIPSLVCLSHRTTATPTAPARCHSAATSTWLAPSCACGLRRWAVALLAGAQLWTLSKIGWGAALPAASLRSLITPARAVLHLADPRRMCHARLPPQVIVPEKRLIVSEKAVLLDELAQAVQVRIRQCTH